MNTYRSIFGPVTETQIRICALGHEPKYPTAPTQLRWRIATIARKLLTDPAPRSDAVDNLILQVTDYRQLDCRYHEIPTDPYRQFTEQVTDWQ